MEGHDLIVMANERLDTHDAFSQATQKSHTRCRTAVYGIAEGEAAQQACLKFACISLLNLTAGPLWLKAYFMIGL